MILYVLQWRLGFSFFFLQTIVEVLHEQFWYLSLPPSRPSQLAQKTLPVDSQALPVGSQALPAGSETLPTSRGPPFQLFLSPATNSWGLLSCLYGPISCFWRALWSPSTSMVTQTVIVPYSSKIRLRYNYMVCVFNRCITGKTILGIFQIWKNR